MKKSLIIILAVTLVLTLTGCKKKHASVTPVVSSSKSETVYKEPDYNGGITIIDDTPASVPTVTSVTSEAASDYEIEDFFGEAHIVGYYGDGGKINIPQMIGGKTVVMIDEYAFRGAEVTSVIIPGTVREIETHAFSGCYLLETLTLAEGVEIIDGYAFANCEQLTYVTLPDSVREINAGAFNYCPKVRVTFKEKMYTAENLEELYEFF